MHRKEINKNKNTGDDILFNYFRENLEEIEFPVSDGCWENISRQVTNQTVGTKKKLAFRWSAIAAILLIALLSGILYHISVDTPAPLVVEHIEQQIQNPYPTATDGQQSGSMNTEKTVARQTEEADRNAKGSNAKTALQYAKQSKGKNIVQPVFLAQTDKVNIFSDSTQTSHPVADVSEGQPYLAPKATDKSGQDSIDIAREKELQHLLDIYNNVQQDGTLVAELTTNDKRSDKWGISASFSSATSSSNAIHQTMPINTLSINSVYLIPKSAKGSITDIDYAPPFSVGLTVSKELNKTLAVETGVTYSYLSTKYRDLYNNSYSTEVKLHYLGVPVNLLVNIWDVNSRFRVYASAGAMLEKGIKFNFSQDNIEEKQTITEKRSINGVQWSLNGAVGVSYRFYDNWNVYVEPQMSYFFDNDQPISIRTEKDAIFSLNSGIRYQF